MKRIFTSALCLLFSITVFGQAQHALNPALKDKHNFKPTDISAYLDFQQQKKNQSAQRGVNNILIDYGASAGDTDAFVWFSNTTYGQLDSFTLQFAILTLDTLFDELTSTPQPWAAVDSYRVDTITAFITHVNHSGTNDSIFISLVDLDAQGVPTANRLWNDTIVTDTSLSPGAFLLAPIQIVPEVLFPPSQRVGVRFDYVGAQVDTFSHFITYLDDCGGSCAANQSVFWPNTFYQFNMGAGLSGFHTGSSLFIDCNSNGSTDVDDCEVYYLQNMATVVDLTLYQSLFVGTSPDTSICEGEVAHIRAMPVGGSGTYDYSWTPSTGLSCATCANTDAQPSSTTTYTVQVIDPGVDTVTGDVTVEVVDIEVTLPADETLDCGEDASYLGSFSGTNSPSFQWQLDGQDIDGETGSSIAIDDASNEDAGTYTLIVTDGNSGCTGTDDIVVSLNVTQSVNFDAPDTADKDAPVKLTNTSNELTGWKWKWNFGVDPGSFNTQESPTTVYTAVGNYTISLEAQSETNPGCVLSTEQEITIVEPPVGIGMAGSNYEISVFPNPTAGNIRIEYTAPEQDDVTLTLLNIEGQQIMTQQVNEVSTFNKQLQLDHLAKGIYLLKVQNSKGTTTSKITLMK